MDAPDKIWIIKDGDRNFGGHKIPLVSDRDIWADYPNDTEYIRADLVQSLIKAAIDLDRQFCDDDLGPSALVMGKLREAYMRLK